MTPSGATPLVAGTRLGAELCLERPLAERRLEGVWLARRTGPEGRETEVAVKLLGGRDADPELRERLGREAVALAGLAHAHVVRVLGRGATGDGVPFLVMELCRGETLRERILRSALPLDEAARVVGELCAALGSVHAAGLVHRDVRPEHVLLEAPAGRVKLVGFASAPPLAGASAAPSYRSPERIREPGADDVDGDLWSIGALAYEMVTGRPAFADTTADGVARSVCEGRFARPGALGLPAALDGFFARAFAPERAARFHSAHDLGVAFAHTVLLALAEQSARAASLASEIALSVPIVVAPSP
ncbi:MAG: serine/threonine protein kinase, partial [Myxococcales bacterium]|nr:serine/threonine protein kinase [Myxococcales bacterium]